VKNQIITPFISILLAFGIATSAHAEDRVGAVPTGFYGGVSLRDHATESAGIALGPASSVWNRYVAPIADDSSARALVFGGYRWRNDLAVEASFNSVDQYALRPDPLGSRHGVGLQFGSTEGLGQPTTRSWNFDVFTSWTFHRALALYGRVGYGQSETLPSFGAVSPAVQDGRRLRDGVNVGLGMRYDMNSALGLRVEYARFGRFAGEIGTSLPETDQVSFGVQLRF
jgi:Outer membrane protein beta-barrel domain